MKLNRYTTLAALALLITAASHGAVIIPTAVTATSEYNGGGGDFRAAAETINGSGLNAGGLHNQSPDPANGGGMWLTNATQTATITFDLGSVQTIDQLIVWNYNEVNYLSAFPAGNSTSRGVQNFSLLADNIATPTTLIGAFTLTKSVASDSSANVSGGNKYGLNFTGGAQTISLSAPVTAQYFSFQVTSNHGDADNYTGLSEVRFNAVPEASSCALLGLGLLGLVSRRRRNA